MADLTRQGQIAYIRYEGGVYGEKPVDRHMEEPLAVVIGMGRVPLGVEKALRVLEVGESVRLVIPPEEGYGEAFDKYVKWYPRAVIPHGYDIKEGTFIMWESADGLAKRPTYVAEATDDAVKLDMNHPFAGKTLEYWVELVDLK